MRNFECSFFNITKYMLKIAARFCMELYVWFHELRFIGLQFEEDR